MHRVEKHQILINAWDGINAQCSVFFTGICIHDYITQTEKAEKN